MSKLISEHPPMHSARTEGTELADLTKEFRGLTGWIHKQSVLGLVRLAVPDFFNKCPSALLQGDISLLEEVRSNFASAFTTVVAKGASISPEKAISYAITLEAACQLLNRRVEHKNKIFALGAEQGIVPKALLNAKVFRQNDKLSADVVESLTRIARFLRMHARLGDAEQSSGLEILRLPNT